MATYTIVTGAAEEKALAFKVAEKNAQRLAEDNAKNGDKKVGDEGYVAPRAPLTNEQYLDQILVKRSLLAFKDMMEAEEKRQVAEAFAAATNAKQTAVKTTLGL